MSIISLLKTENYEPNNLLESVNLSLKNIRFDTGTLKGARVAVKPNLLTAAAPESGVTTHPEFFRAVVRLIKNSGGIPVLVESPAFFNLDYVLRKCGYDVIINEERIMVGDTTKTALIKNPDGVKYRSFHVAEDLVSCDLIFSLPKLKTHSLTYFTGAVKNLFGSIHGLEKSKWHLKTETENEFISFLLDLYGAFVHEKRDNIISIMDGIIGLEGEGPGKSGLPVSAKAIIAGSDAIALDSVAIAVAGLDINRAPVCLDGERRGLGISSMDRIEIAGVSLNGFSNRFTPPKTGTFLKKLPVSAAFLKNLFVKKPVPERKKCTLCYQCRTICPAGVIEKSRDNRVPFYNYSKCIRCYCCMEICPEGAIELRRKF